METPNKSNNWKERRNKTKRWEYNICKKWENINRDQGRGKRTDWEWDIKW